MLNSFAKIYTVGDRETINLFNGDIEVTEKIDGSFFGFGIQNDKLVFRSRKQTIPSDTEGGIFGKTVQAIIEREESIREFDDLHPGIIFFGEAVSKPKHNKLTYEECPEGNIVLWGARIDDSFITYSVLKGYARELQLSTVQSLTDKIDFDQNSGTLFGQIEEIIKTVPSILGGSIEGVVIRSLDFNSISEGLPVHGKMVGEVFREKMNSKVSTSKKPTLAKVFDIFDNSAKKARWAKALQHLDEENKLSGSVRDIGSLMRELTTDFRGEDHEDLKEMLFKIFAPDIIKHIQNGLPDWYKKELQIKLEPSKEVE